MNLYLFVIFLIAYTQGANICNLRDTSSTSGDVSSPGYPRGYPANQKCSFAIRVPSGNSIVVTFKEIDLEHEADEGSCYDYIEITDLVTKEKEMFCEKKLPEEYVSKSNQVEIMFASDHSDPVKRPKGFLLSYTTKRNIQATPVCPGRVYIAKPEGGYLSSPNFPFNYRNNLNCKFTLIVPAGKKTHIAFEELNTEFDEKCQNDRLNISSNTKANVLCGQGQPPSRVLYGSKVIFHFITNGRTTAKGFLLKYHFSKDETSPNDCVCPRGNAYVKVDLSRRKLNRDTDDIHFEFKTTQQSSLLLYAMGRHRDFLSVHLHEGQIKFEVDLGTGKGSITPPSRVLNDGTWHKVEIQRTGRRIKVNIDNGLVAGIVYTRGNFNKLDLRPPGAYLYVAGSSRNLGPNFIGCLRNFVIDKRRSIMDALNGDPAHTMYFASLPRCPSGSK